MLMSKQDIWKLILHAQKMYFDNIQLVKNFSPFMEYEDSLLNPAVENPALCQE